MAKLGEPDERAKFFEIQKKIDEIATEDCIKAILAVEEDLGTLKVVRKYKWDDIMFSLLPSSLMPKIEKRDEGMSRSDYVALKKKAETINEILIKSWETQGSLCPGFDEVTSTLMGPRGAKEFKDQLYPSKVLVTSRPMEINTLLMYYLKNLDLGNNMDRVVGAISANHDHRFVYSFLKLNKGDLLAKDHFIDNTFSHGEVKSYKMSPQMIFNQNLTNKYIEGDPADPKYKVNQCEWVMAQHGLALHCAV